MSAELFHGDCLDVMKNIADKSVNMVFADLPYGSTASKWDEIIDFRKLWRQYYRILMPDGVIALFCAIPFTHKLISSNHKTYRYRWVWIKNFGTNFYHVKRQPIRIFEEIAIFYINQPTYNPQKTSGHAPTQSARGVSSGVVWHGENIRNYNGGQTDRYPVNVISFRSVDPKRRLHPHEKPVPLCEYFIKTYTNENDLVLDNTMGACSSGEAAINLGRNYIGIEKEKKFFMIAAKRLQRLK